MFAQKEVSGVVTDNTGLTLPGVAVFVKGTDVGTATDFDGKYIITVPSGNEVLNFSSVGFITKDVPVNNQSVLNVELEVSNESLEEIVVIGYGSRKKQDLTGAVSVVSKDDLVAFPSQTVEQTLQGRAAGVQVQSNNGGEPGAPIKIRIRGGTSINASSAPLFVVDGFVGGALPAPEDIASLQILKDASSTAIYGSRGANGVVIVTTKKGVQGEIKVELNSSYSLHNVSNTLNLLNADQYADYQNDAIRSNLGPGDTFTPFVAGTEDTDWQDTIFRSGSISNHQVSVSGGGDKTQFYISTSFLDQEGTIINSGANRLSVVGNISANVNDHVKVGLSMLGRRSNRDGIASQSLTGGAGSAGVISAALRYRPDIGVRDSDGNFTVDQEIDNPFVAATERINNRKDDLFQANAFVEFQLLKGLSLKSTFGYNVRNNRLGEYFSGSTIRGEATAADPTTNVEAVGPGEARIRNSKNTDFVTEHYLTYKKDFSNSKISTTVGYSYNKFVRERFESTFGDFPQDNLGFEGIDNAINFLDVDANFSERELASYFGRINFDLADKYLFTLSARADGASTFPSENQWGYFPSGAFAWNMGKETFLEDVDPISQWKWRVSYGWTGNASTSAGGSLPSFRSFTGQAFLNGEPAPGLAISNLGSPELTWETTKQLNLGIDLGFFNNRLNLSADYYDMTTEDVIVSVVPTSLTGSTQTGGVLTNSGSIDNKGFEIQLSTKNLVGDFQWNTDFNISANKNEIASLPGGLPIIIASGPGHLLLNQTQIIQEGSPVGAFYGLEYAGVAQLGDDSGLDPGSPIYRDVNEDEIISNDDNVVIGDPNPDFIAGLNNSFYYKGIDLNIFFQGSFGNDILNYTNLELNTLIAANNATTAVLDRWTPANPNTNIPQAGRDRLVLSDRFVEDGSYIRLKNVTLGYSLDKNVLDKLKLSKLRFYISGQNLLTFTNYSGLDPEASFNASSTRESNVNIGLDYASFPNFRAFTMGVNVSF